MNTDMNINPDILGPGLWFKIHVDAVQAITDDLKEAFAININALCTIFKCTVCQKHFSDFIKLHPLIDYWYIEDNGRDIGFYKWSWELHNQVNRRLGKYEPKLFESYEYYTNPEIGACFNCGEQKSTQSDSRTRTILTPYQEPQPSKSLASTMLKLIPRN